MIVNKAALTLIFVLCVNQGYTQLTFYLPSSSASEGSCISPPVATNIDGRWLKQARLYYVPFGSKSMYRRYAETFLGRPAKSVDELDAMCLQVQLSGKKMTTFGHGKTVEQSCPATQTGIMNCFVNNGSPGTNLTAIDTTVETVVYTDNKSAVLLVRCVNDEVKDYKLLSTEKQIPSSSKVLADVKAKLTQLKFSSLYLAKMGCDGTYAVAN